MVKKRKGARNTRKIVIDKKDVEAYCAEYKLLHPNSRIAPIKAPSHPSINEWMIKARPAMNSMKQKWKEFAVWIVREYGWENEYIKSCDLIFTTYFNNKRRRDNDNYTPKFIMDGFVDAGLLLDDSSSVVKSLTIKCDYDKENPRMEFLFTNVE